MKTTLAIIFLASAIVAQARLGENKEALIKRFGPPVENPIGGGKLKFKKGGFVITCDLAAQREVYEVDGGGEFSSKTIDFLLGEMANLREVVEFEDAENGQKRWTLGRFGVDKRSDYVTLSRDKKRLTVAALGFVYDTKQKQKENPVGF